MINDILVFDDFIPVSYQNEIQKVLFDDAQWMLKYDITYSRKNFNKLVETRPGLTPRPGFHHALVQNAKVVSPTHFLFKPMLLAACEKANITLEEVTLGRSFLQIPLTHPEHFNIKDPLHVDTYFSHIVILYYVVSSDGDTIITDKKFKLADIENRKLSDGLRDETIDVRYEDCNIVKRITPKKGRVVVFDGGYYHAGEQSKQSMRCIINYNVMGFKNV